MPGDCGRGAPSVGRRREIRRQENLSSDKCAVERFRQEEPAIEEIRRTSRS
jgi:hypothetical protein